MDVLQLYNNSTIKQQVEKLPSIAATNAKNRAKKLLDLAEQVSIANDKALKKS